MGEPFRLFGGAGAIGMKTFRLLQDWISEFDGVILDCGNLAVGSDIGPLDFLQEQGLARRGQGRVIEGAQQSGPYSPHQIESVSAASDIRGRGRMIGSPQHPGSDQGLGLVGGK
jgi:hypothetical protein